jgi:DNA ligase (NAD+)
MQKTKKETMSPIFLIRTIRNLEVLSQLGFKTPFQERGLFTSIIEVESFCKEWENKRDSYPIDIDGMVIKVNSIQQQQLVGKTSHHPKWAIAYKFKAKQAMSTLLQVDFQIGRTGAITPVAKIAPVQLMGVEISSVSLHNEDFILDKDIPFKRHRSGGTCRRCDSLHCWKCKRKAKWN